MFNYAKYPLTLFNFYFDSKDEGHKRNYVAFGPLTLQNRQILWDN